MPMMATGADFGLSITDPANGDWDGSVDQAIKAGATSVSLMLFWDDFDKNGSYAPDSDWPQVANDYYPAKGLRLNLVIATLDTVADRRPDDLKGRAWDDPELARRFVGFIEQVLARLDDTELVAIVIGNEVDGVLAGDEWSRYRAFFQAVKPAINGLRPGVPVGMTFTWQGLQDSENAQALARVGDAWMVNYYPLDRQFRVLPNAGFPAELDRMIALAAPQPVMLSETGYPSGGCNAPPEGQLDFVQMLLSAWQARKTQMPFIEINWLNDISEAELAGYRSYYGVAGDCFQSYLATLGLRARDGTAKPALTWLQSR